VEEEIMKTRFVLIALVAMLALGLPAQTAAGPIIAFTPSGLTQFNENTSGLDGLFFTPTTGITVTALGYIEPAAPAAGWPAAGNQVGLYQVAGASLLGNTTVTSVSQLNAGFRYNSITPINLTAGVQYAVVGLYLVTPGGNYGYGFTAGGVATGPGITLNGYKYQYTSSLGLPTVGYEPPIFGPNFQYTVPDGGATLALLGCALVGLGLLRRKFRG
jgi:hypothetical protein